MLGGVVYFCNILVRTGRKAKIFGSPRADVIFIGSEWSWLFRKAALVSCQFTAQSWHLCLNGCPITSFQRSQQDDFLMHIKHKFTPQKQAIRLSPFCKATPIYHSPRQTAQSFIWTFTKLCILQKNFPCGIGKCHVHEVLNHEVLTLLTNYLVAPPNPNRASRSKISIKRRFEHCDGLKIVHHKLSNTHEVGSPTRDPAEGVPMASGQVGLTNYVPGPLVYKALHSTVQ